MDIVSYITEMWQLVLQGELKGLWFWGALYVFVVCCYSIVFQIRTRLWPSTKGILVELDAVKVGGPEWVRAEQDYIVKGIYRYTVNDIEYVGSKISPWIFMASHNARGILFWQLKGVERYSDGKVKVFYNPGKHHKALLIVASRTGIAVTALIALIPAISFYLRFYL